MLVSQQLFARRPYCCAIAQKNHKISRLRQCLHSRTLRTTLIYDVMLFARWRSTRRPYVAISTASYHCRSHPKQKMWLRAWKHQQIMFTC